MSLIYKIYMEVYAVEGDKPNHLHCEKQQIHIRKDKMNKMNVNLNEAMNYFIQLFYQTEQVYSCTRTKLGKLLSILAFKFAVKDILLFDSTIYKYPPSCGTIIKDLEFLIRKNIYIRDSNLFDMDKQNAINPYTINRNIFVPSEFTQTSSLCDEIKAEIENVFLKFGAYSGNDLGELLNPIVDKIVIVENNELNLFLLKQYNKEDFGVVNNSIINYIYKS